MNNPIFLDWDGVLVDSLSLYFELFRDLCRKHDKTFPISTIDEFREWYEPNWEINFAELGFSDAEYQEICNTYPDTLDYGSADLFQGVEEMIAELAERHPLIVVSTAPTRNIKTRLADCGLLSHFQDVTGSDDGSTNKIDRIAELLKDFNGATGVMVGDTDLDIEAGRANGMKTIGVTYGWISEQRVRKARPNYVVTEPSSLQGAVVKALAG